VSCCCFRLRIQSSNRCSSLCSKSSTASEAVSSTNPPKKRKVSDSPLPVPTATPTKDINNYAKDTLTIASVSGAAAPTPTAALSAQQQLLLQQQIAQNNKISLVPTKLLLKPQSLVPSSTPTIVYSSHQVTPGTASITTNAQSSNSVPMKVVFVNALNNAVAAQQQQQQQNQKAQITMQQLTKQPATLVQSQNSTFKLVGAPHHAGGTTTTKVKLVQSTNLARVTTTTAGNSISSILPKEPSTESSSTSSSSTKPNKTLMGEKMPGERAQRSFMQFIHSFTSSFAVIRNLLTNIVAIEKERLEIERQRFEYEKSVGNELLQMLRTFVGATAKDETTATTATTATS